MKNYKKIRQKPYIYGFSVLGFFIFAIGGIIGIASMMAGFSFVKLIVCLFILLTSFSIGKVVSNEELMNKFLDNKLPNKYSDYE
ncbi:hypothetical protein V3471_14740 [Flavobacterium oreochromis]|uniref:hypothetical protein n=1 Tax=Flavobacterium oreochromis TaxID=2906078 RepID=UPI00385B5E65